MKIGDVEIVTSVEELLEIETSIEEYIEANGSDFIEELSKLLHEYANSDWDTEEIELYTAAILVGAEIYRRRFREQAERVMQGISERDLMEISLREASGNE